MALDALNVLALAGGSGSPMWSAVLILGGTGLVCAAILAVAAKAFHVHEDPRIGQVAAMLPGVNCGGCGFAGCSDYARRIVESGLDVTLCKPGGEETVSRIASFLGVTAKAEERKVAIVLCQGGDNVAVRHAGYNGIADCVAADLAGGAGKGCRYGCLGLGSCSRVCPAGAIEILSERLAVVHPEMCIGCGKCAATCPRKLIRMVPESRFIHILCSSRDRGPVTRKLCSVGCIACTLCFKACGGNGIRMEGSLAVVDYANPLENEEVIARCPQHTIVRRTGRREPASARPAA
jgi:electron transport complex protein RnfB